MNKEEIRQKAIEYGKAFYTMCTDEECYKCKYVQIAERIPYIPCSAVYGYERGFADGFEECKKQRTSEAKRYLIYVTRYDVYTDGGNVTDVYDYEGDVFHAMGEIYFYSEVRIYRMNYVEYSDERVKFWINMGCKISKWRDKKV